MKALAKQDTTALLVPGALASTRAQQAGMAVPEKHLRHAPAAAPLVVDARRGRRAVRPLDALVPPVIRRATVMAGSVVVPKASAPDFTPPLRVPARANAKDNHVVLEAITAAAVFADRALLGGTALLPV